jgi:O-acetyl-ADP-ribose deacetylase (regulator of RNase III)/uncharacterized membrane-anchored protein YhcB (DUF1043 family)
MSSVLLDFDSVSNCLLLSGCAEEVETAEKHVKSCYISAICHGQLQIRQPGLKQQDFTEFEGRGEMAIGWLQSNFKCAIELLSEDGKRCEKSSRVPHVRVPAKFTAHRHRPRPHSVTSSQLAINIVKGNIAVFKADVVVNIIASKSHELSQCGAVANAFFDVAGMELQRELEDNDWPVHFGQVVSTPACGGVIAKKIYHTNVRKYSDHHSLKLLQRMLSNCLKMAQADGVASIAFPTVGCGKLGYSPTMVVESFIQAQSDVGPLSLTITIVAYEDELYRTFKSCLSRLAADSDKGGQGGRRDCAGSIKMDPMPAAELHLPSPSRLTPIKVQSGSLTDFQADVLVNLIASRNCNMAKAGAVAACFLRVGGPQLQQDLMRQQIPLDFGSDVAITRAYGGLQAQYIYHAAIRRYRDSQSIELLYRMVSKCLKMAADNRTTSIAFPTIGCGRLGYDPADVANCFIRAQLDTRSSLKITIVSYEDDLSEKFAGYISQHSERNMRTNGRTPAALTSSKQSLKKHNCTKMVDLEDEVEYPDAADDLENAKPAGWFSRLFHFGGQKQMEATLPDPVPQQNGASLKFEISALDQNTIDKVKEKLREQIEALVDTFEISSDVIDGLDKQTMEKIRHLSSVDVTVEIDKKNKKIILKGRKEFFSETKSAVTKLLQKQESNENDLEYIKKKEGVPGYLRHIGSSKGISYPQNWSCVISGKVDTMVEGCRQPVIPKSVLFTDIKKLVMGTWELGKIGQGRDASNLAHNSIEIQNIWTIENPGVFRKYYTTKKEICLNAAVNHFPRIDGLQNEHEVRTKRHTVHNAKLIKEINEYYLFHGTKATCVPSIEHFGLDGRMTGDNSLFGRGIYFAESSTKADQYADDKTKRVGANQPLYMYVVRVLLGNAFVCQQPQPFKKPPCTSYPKTCADPCCTEHKAHFDSLIGTHRPDNARLIFREFIVYDGSQCYPEFLVEYVRK